MERGFRDCVHVCGLCVSARLWIQGRRRVSEICNALLN